MSEQPFITKLGMSSSPTDLDGLRRLRALQMSNSEIGEINNNNNNNSILYFNVLTQQLQEQIAESAQEDKYIHSKEINIKMRTKLNQIHIII
jgi:hypothetical protein